MSVTGAKVGETYVAIEIQETLNADGNVSMSVPIKVSPATSPSPSSSTSPTDTKDEDQEENPSEEKNPDTTTPATNPDGSSSTSSEGTNVPTPITPEETNASTSTTSDHTHNYTWVTVQEATKLQDGLEEYKCDCGMVEERSVIPSSQVYVKELYGKLKDAAENGTVTFDSGKLYTISDYIIKKLQDRNDVTTVIDFEYNQAKYRMTIPAGVDYTKLLEDQDYFYGYFFFANEVGATIENL